MLRRWFCRKPESSWLEDNMKDWLKKWSEWFTGRKQRSLLVGLGLVGILLIATSGLFSQKEKEQAVSVTAMDDAVYCGELEQKVGALVRAITGDADCIVAITLENGNEYIYADQNTIDSDHSEDNVGDGVTTKESRKSEQQYIIVEDGSGAETALIVTEKKPSVRGVAIVAAGVNDATAAQLLDAVSSMLGVAERKISITSKAEW